MDGCPAQFDGALVGAVWFGVWFFKVWGKMGAGVFLRWSPMVLCLVA